MNKLTTRQFIKKAKEIHDDKYDYSKVKYENLHEKIIIICTIHKEFLQEANSHLKGIGCPKCSKKYQYTTRQFIKKAREVHKDKYNYSKVEYINSKTKICIICPEHGEFWQNPNSHLRNCKCPSCVSGYKKDTFKTFIEKANKIHGDKYDYSKVKYIGSHNKVCIICPEHGEFWQKPQFHLRKGECSICVSEKTKKVIASKFTKEAKKIHGNKYDYSKIEYERAHNKICIICPEHGEFWQRPDNHLNGSGCPFCKSSQGENNIRNFLLENNIKFKVQKIFDGCKNTKCLPFDFYLPEYNTIIEYDGIQHYEPIEYFGGQENFKYLKNNDKIKNEFCNENNIDLIRVPYWINNVTEYLNDKIC